jgi:small subunit ribosomal protein S8
MATTDPIANMLSIIRNGQMARLVEVSVPYSQIKENILEVLKSEGYINSYRSENIRKNIDYLYIELKYSSDASPAIKKIERTSTPGRRVYNDKSEIKSYYNNLGMRIFTTSYGVITDREARSRGIGGEEICKVF